MPVPTRPNRSSPTPQETTDGTSDDDDESVWGDLPDLEEIDDRYPAPSVGLPNGDGLVFLGFTDIDGRRFDHIPNIDAQVCAGRVLQWRPHQPIR